MSQASPQARAESRAEAVTGAKRQLLQARGQVLKELGHLHECMQVELDLEPDEGDEELVELDRNAALSAILQRRLEAIEAALRLIAEGHYGVCVRCGQAILPERLQAKPDATLCVVCQQESERLNRYRLPIRQIHQAPW